MTQDEQKANTFSEETLRQNLRYFTDQFEIYRNGKPKDTAWEDFLDLFIAILIAKKSPDPGTREDMSALINKYAASLPENIRNSLAGMIRISAENIPASSGYGFLDMAEDTIFDREDGSSRAKNMVFTSSTKNLLYGDTKEECLRLIRKEGYVKVTDTGSAAVPLMVLKKIRESGADLDMSRIRFFSRTEDRNAARKWLIQMTMINAAGRMTTVDEDGFRVFLFTPFWDYPEAAGQ